MAKRFLQSVAVVACAAAFVYALILLGKSGTLQNVWAVLKAGHGGL